MLLKEDKKKLFEMLKKLNARQEYAYLAQKVLAEVLPRYDAQALLDDPDAFKDSKVSLKQMTEATEAHSAKHYSRTDGTLKRTYYVEYVLSQMTLMEDRKQEQNNADRGSSDQETAPMERRRDKKAK